MVIFFRYYNFPIFTTQYDETYNFDLISTSIIDVSFMLLIPESSIRFPIENWNNKSQQKTFKQETPHFDRFCKIEQCEQKRTMLKWLRMPTKLPYRYCSNWFLASFKSFFSCFSSARAHRIRSINQLDAFDGAAAAAAAAQRKHVY